MERQSFLLNIETNESVLRKSRLLPSLHHLNSMEEKRTTRGGTNGDLRDKLTDFALTVNFMIINEKQMNNK